MKKILAIITAALAVSSAYADYALQIGWGSEENFGDSDGFADVFASVADGGAEIPTSSTWAAQVLDLLDSTVYATATHPGGGSGFWDFYGDPGVAFQVAYLPPAATGRQFFTRLYNNSDPLLATMKADVGTSSFTWDPQAGTPPTPKDYNFGTVASGDWAAVPEPGAASLLILGAGTFLVRRMRARFAAK